VGTGITDYAAVCRKYAEFFTASGGRVLTNTKVVGISRHSDETVVETTAGAFSTTYLVNCAGLYSDTISRMAGQQPDIAIVPFRGEYYELAPHRRDLVRGLIYPVPNPALPFLGAHLTPRVQGGVEAGPNAVLAFSREGYRPHNINLGDLARMLAYVGFWRMAAKQWHTGIREFYRSLSKPAFLRELQRLVPELQSSDLSRAGSGVRAQAVRSNGTFADDFEFQQTENMLHVYNVPSPAATASIPIGGVIVRMMEDGFGLR
jgi:L-2-hydroxyglutarate oxidase LhgO